jgi:UDP-glucuronate 4-epimerase
MKAIQEKLPLQEGDVPDTYADVSALANLSGYRPETTVQQGVHNFVQWYKKYYKI